MSNISQVFIGAPSSGDSSPYRQRKEKFAQVRGIRKDPQQRPGDVLDRAWAFLYLLLYV